MIPIYIFYSMFGFQRTGDGFWAAADQMTRGFVLGATAGRTTLNGEGLQHEDGHSLLLALDQPGRGRLRPGVRLRDRATSSGTRLRRMYGDDAGERLLLPDASTTSRSSSRPSRRTSTSRASCAGMYRYAAGAATATAPKAQILASGVAVPWALRGAASCCRATGACSADVWSVTSWTELRRDGRRGRRAQPAAPRASEPQVPYVTAAAAGRRTARSSRCRTGCARCRT